MNQKIGDQNSMKVLGLFFLVFAILLFIAVFFTETPKAKITNSVCALILAGIATFFFYGYLKQKRRSDG